MSLLLDGVGKWGRWKILGKSNMASFLVVWRGFFWHRDEPGSRGLSMGCEPSRQVPFQTKTVAPSPLMEESVAEPEENTKGLGLAGNLQ